MVYVKIAISSSIEWGKTKIGNKDCKFSHRYSVAGLWGVSGVHHFGHVGHLFGEKARFLHVA